MARDFDGVANSLSLSSAVVPNEPFTFSCWFNTDVVDARDLMQFYENAGTHEIRLGLRGAGFGTTVQFVANDAGGFSRAETSTSYSTGTWHHACGVAAANNSRAVYLDGAGKGTNGVNKVLTLDRTAIGRNIQLGAQALNGRMAELGIWNTALSDDEVASLARGFVPTLIRPQSLVSYWPLIGRLDPELDRWNGGNDLTVTGAVVGDHVPDARYGV